MEWWSSEVMEYWIHFKPQYSITPLLRLINKKTNLII